MVEEAAVPSVIPIVMGSLLGVALEFGTIQAVNMIVVNVTEVYFEKYQNAWDIYFR